MTTEKLAKYQDRIEKYRNLIDAYQNWRYIEGASSTNWDFLIFYVQEENENTRKGVGCKFFPDREPEKFKADFPSGDIAPKNFQTVSNLNIDLLEKLREGEPEYSCVKIEGQNLYVGEDDNCAGCGKELEKGEEVEPRAFFLYCINCHRKTKMMEGLER